MARILGIDYGKKRIGFAIGDEDGILSTPLRTASVGTTKEAVQAVRDAVEDTSATAIVIGLPRNMDGSMGEMARRVESFAARARDATGLDVDTWDERLSSRLAERVLLDADLSRAKRKRVLDKLAAQVILQGYLDAQSSSDTAGDLERP